MKKFTGLCFIIFLLFDLYLFSQTIEKIIVKSDGKVYQSKPTKEKFLYRITVEGTYSMWPQFPDCHGVDGIYVYDVPQEEIDAMRWPPKSFKLLDVEIPFVEIPHWLGDEKLWSFPPKEIFTPLFELSFRKYTGFRIDNEPMPNSGLNMATHRYQIEKVGTGSPFNFQILDSTYNIIQERVIPRYEDNCGELTITIEEINNENDINICDVGTICKDGQIIGIRLSAAIFAEDTTKASGKNNKLKEINLKQLGIVHNGEFLCDIDSIICERKKPISIGLVIDRSGSMLGPISNTDQTVRLNAAKSSLSSFIKQFSQQDSAFILSFSSNITIDQDWTNDKSKLTSSINGINAFGSTSFYDAVLAALDKVSTSASPLRALVLLSDGGRTSGSEWSDDILNKISQKNIPIYMVALGFTSDPYDIEGRAKMQLIADASRGKVFDVSNSSKLDSVYAQLGEEIGNDECCTIYFKIDGCDEDNDNFVKIIYAPSDTITLSKVVKFNCKCEEGGIVGIIESPEFETQSNIDFTPNPVLDLGIVTYKVFQNSNVSISLTSLTGNTLWRKEIGIQDIGTYNFDVNTSNLKNGTYFINVYQNSMLSSRKIMVIH